MNKLQTAVAEMLTENTGRHMLDSGGAYGRNWERNQGRKFEDEKPFTMSWRWRENGPEYTWNLFHFLTEHALSEYDDDAQAKFEEWAEQDGRDDDSWFTNVDDYMTALADDGFQVGGLYGEGEPWTVNTYNGEDALSQTIQWTMFKIGYDTDTEDELQEKYGLMQDTTYVFLFVHGGCDVRGGYTKPRIFEAGQYDDTNILDNARATLHCTECEANWMTDDAGCHWYYDGSSAGGDSLVGKTGKRVNVTTEEWEFIDRVAERFIAAGYYDAEPSEARRDAVALVMGETAVYMDESAPLLVVNEDTDTGHCPECYEGTLEVWS